MGQRTLATIRASFYMPDRNLYALEINSGKRSHPSWIWDASIQLGALCAAARLEPQTYLSQVKAYASALRGLSHDVSRSAGTRRQSAAQAF